MRYFKLWLGLGLIVALSFVVLGYYGVRIYQQAPPVPERVVTDDGRVVLTGDDIHDGMNVWRTTGGQELGSIWGHGAYVAPDWSADWLHRESLWLLNQWSAAEHGRPFAELGESERVVLQRRLEDLMRTNRYDAASGTLTIPTDRARSIAAMTDYYAAIFGDAESFPPELRAIADGGLQPPELRDAYAMPALTVRDPERRRQLGAFFFWTAWACAAERPGGAIEQVDASSTTPRPVSYTNNWPPERLVGNRPTGEIVVWSVLSFVLLLAGVGALVWYYASLRGREEMPDELPEKDPLLAIQATPSMRATLKYFWVVAALIVVQVILGAVTAHYGVEGGGFYGFPLANWLPYAVTRTWHLQLGLFWIATAWLATGLYMAPAVSGHEPRGQKAGVDFLFVCLLVIVVGTLFGTWYATRQRMGFTTNFWFGHQGYEYVDLGRFWQAFLLVGLFLWLGLMLRALWPAFRNLGEHRHLLALFAVASAAIALFYGAGMFWGPRTNLAIAEYWRWWVVHLWVEGFFEVFATVLIAFLFVRMGLLRGGVATAAVLFSTCVFLFGGILGTFHHLYFSGTPTAVLAIGATFSAFEVVPLVLIGFEGYQNLTIARARPWVSAYKWPIYFFVAVAFWNLVGAGLFGFLINPPIALYFMQGLNTTPVHGHTALFGVYGMLGMGLLLFCLRGLTRDREWRNGPISFAFWSVNVGLALMVLLSMLPVGMLQTWASVEHGMWWARSAQFLQTELMDTLRWLRVVGDTIFAIGIVVFGWFVLGLKTGWSLRAEREHALEQWAEPVRAPR
ncbi:MAG TPA: nitric-oxide reductase large subunit [Candidatus Binatia bacterium]